MQQPSLAIEREPTPVEGRSDADLAGLRLRIREIDRSLVDHLAERLELCRQVGRRKRAVGAPVRNPEVEARVIASARAAATRAGLAPSYAERFIRAVIELAVAIQIADN